MRDLISITRVLYKNNSSKISLPVPHCDWAVSTSHRTVWKPRTCVHEVRNTWYAAKQNLRVKTNIGKQIISFIAIDLWQELPFKFKDLAQFAFTKSVKNYILSAISSVRFWK